MATYVITDPEGKEWEASGNGTKDEALAHFQSQWKPKSQAAPSAPAGNDPSEDAGGVDLAGAFGHLANVAGIATPLAAIAANPEVTAPILGGAAGALGAGYAAHKLMEATGAQPMLDKAAQYARDSFGGMTEPKHQSVTLNMAQNLLQEVTDPRAGVANALSALPTAAEFYLSAKGAKGIGGALTGLQNKFFSSPEVPLTAQQQAAKILQGKGYPVTDSHVSGDTALKATMTNQNLAPESKAYLEKLQQAGTDDVRSALKPPVESNVGLGNKVSEAFQGAENQRSTSFADMLKQAESTHQGGEVTGLGKVEHAGKKFSLQVNSQLKDQGVKVTPELRMKALTEGGLGMYDVPAGVNPADVTASLRFADLASQKAKNSVQLDALAKQFAKNENIFSEGKASGNGFKKGVQNSATDMAADLIKKRDKMTGLNDYEGWAKNRANWAKFADLTDQFNGKFGSANTRLTGEKMYSNKEISPEDVWDKSFKDAPAKTINAFKNFLRENGQDPEVVTNLGKKSLDMALSESPAKFESKWRGIKAERKEALYGKETVQAVDEALGRVKSSRSPLEVLGTKASGESQTAAKAAISGAFHGSKTPTMLGGAVGAGIGGSIAGPLGAGVGSAVGAGIGHGVETARAAKALEAARTMLTQPINIAPKPAVNFKSADPSLLEKLGLGVNLGAQGLRQSLR